jgi:hypothetical protein
MSESRARMRLHRARRLSGLRCVLLEIRDIEISELVTRGLLTSANRDSSTAVRDALYKHLDKTLGGPV